MLKQNLKLAIALAGILAVPSGCSSSDSPDDPATMPKDTYYSNPVLNNSAPDPTVIRADDGYYYLYATEDTYNVPIYRSSDLVNWKLMTTAFTNSTRPTMVPDGNIWAPDIHKVNGKYHLYYSKSRWGGEWECGIGVATANSPVGPFTDQGKLFISSEIQVQNSIDPFFIEDEGKKYLFWGSFRGIYGIELSDDGLSVHENARKFQIAGTYMEATCIYKHDGYFYLFGSGGSCCDGANSSYHVVVARSKDLFGPYVNKNGGKALENHFTRILERSDNVIGPGHNSNIVTDGEGNTWMLYHGFVASKINESRKVFLDRIYWDSEGWPYIKDGKPSDTAPAPVF